MIDKTYMLCQSVIDVIYRIHISREDGDYNEKDYDSGSKYSAASCD